MSTEEKKSNLFHKNLEAYGIPPVLHRANGDEVVTSNTSVVNEVETLEGRRVIVWTRGLVLRARIVFSDHAVTKVKIYNRVGAPMHLQLHTVDNSCDRWKLAEHAEQSELELLSEWAGKGPDPWALDAPIPQNTKSERAKELAELKRLNDVAKQMEKQIEAYDQFAKGAESRADVHPAPIDSQTFIGRLKSLESENSELVKTIESQSKIIQALESKLERLRRGKSC